MKKPSSKGKPGKTAARRGKAFAGYRLDPVSQYSQMFVMEPMVKYQDVLTSVDRPYKGLMPPPLSSERFSPEELRILREGGLEEGSFAPGKRPLEETQRAFKTLQSESWSVTRAAAWLGDARERLRERIRTRTLYAFKVGAVWRIPIFQFSEHKELPGLAEVVPRLPPRLHPLVVYRWFTSPNDELEDEREQPLSPLEWLREGRSPQIVASLAEQLGETL